MAVNHASYFDPPLAGVASDRALFYLARRTLMVSPFFRWLLPRLNVIPVDRDGNDRSALKILIHKIRDGEGVVLFPEGTRSPNGQLQSGRAGIGLIVAKTHAPVIPVRIFGSHEAFPRGAKEIRPSKISVVIGKPLDLSALAKQGSGREIYQKISDVIMEEIAKLKLP